MKTCVIDNVATMRREAWEDGHVVAEISATLLAAKGFNGHPRMHLALNCGTWETGALRGDAGAMCKVVDTPDNKK